MHPVRKQRLYVVLFIIVFSSAAIGLVLHLALNLSGLVDNPAVSASYAIIAACAFGLHHRMLFWPLGGKDWQP